MSKNPNAPECHSSSDSQPQCCRFASTSGGSQGHSAPQSLLWDCFNELQHSFSLENTTKFVFAILRSNANRLKFLESTVFILATQSCCMGRCPDLVHGLAALHQNTYRLSVLKRLLQILQLLLTWRQSILLGWDGTSEIRKQQTSWFIWQLQRNDCKVLNGKKS